MHLQQDLISFQRPASCWGLNNQASIQETKRPLLLYSMNAAADNTGITSCSPKVPICSPFPIHEDYPSDTHVQQIIDDSVHLTACICRWLRPPACEQDLPATRVAQLAHLGSAGSALSCSRAGFKMDGGGSQ